MNWNTELEVEIAQVRSIELEALQEEFFLLKEGRIRLLGALIVLYNIRLEELRDERKPWESAETRLEKTLKMLPAIDIEKLKPSPGSSKELKDNIIKDAKGEEWLRIKLLSIECVDGFNFKEMWNK